MREFGSFAEFGLFLGERILAYAEAEHRALERAAELIEKRAKEKIGEYQDQVGPFVAWAELADATKADRARQGYSEDEPLLRTGGLRDTIEHQVRVPEAQIGSNSDIMVYQELGTAKIPPRSVLGGAGFESADKVVEIIADETMIALVGADVFQRRIPLK